LCEGALCFLTVVSPRHKETATIGVAALATILTTRKENGKDIYFSS